MNKINLIALWIVLACAPLGAFAQGKVAAVAPLAPAAVKTAGQATSKTTAAPSKLTEDQKIEILIKSVEISGLDFIRNGTQYNSKKAAEHLRTKYDYARKRPKLAKEVATARDFIKNIASASSISSKPYQIVLKDGKKVPSGEWLTKKLEEIEKGPGQAKPTPTPTPTPKPTPTPAAGRK